MTSLISVIVPIHNGERFLGEALDSIAAQDYDAIEVIVVDDGSTDGGPALAAARDVQLLHQEQRGAGAARNAGIAVARGEILAFLAQDDLWLPSKLRLQVEILTAIRKASASRSSYFLEPGATVPAWFGKRSARPRSRAGLPAVCRAPVRIRASGPLRGESAAWQRRRLVRACLAPEDSHREAGGDAGTAAHSQGE